jgi:DNA-binding NtrC family response regulator
LPGTKLGNDPAVNLTQGENMENIVLRRTGTPDLKINPWCLIGRDEGCDLRLESQDVSPRHARLEKREDGWIIKDLRTTTGTWVNGFRVEDSPIREGDWIRCGSEELLFTSGEDADAFPLQSRNPEWQSVLQSLGSVARTEYPVLLLGPSGTGKDVIAQALHQTSDRRDGPFISVNCGALTETLVESELFGHIKGSFTGAISDRKGAFEAARGGTLFLDEIGDLPSSLQSKLLRALENQEIRPVGSDRTVKTNIRVIAATHQDLNEKVEDGRFRSDLFYRLNVVAISPPALVHRMEDFEDLLYKFCRQMRVRFSVAAILKLKKHHWPGNIREMRNVVARASALFPKQSIEECHVQRLIGSVSAPPSAQPAYDPSPDGTMPVIKEIEKQMILKRLRANRGNQRRTASDLGLPKSTLNDRIRTYGIDAESFKSTQG